jgi:flagellar hook-length control protein FliK
MPDVIAQSLQASMFRADAESDSADTQTAEQKPASEEETDTTITEIIPLSAQLIALPQWANDLQAANKASKDNAEIAPSTALNGIQSATLGARADIDAVIPPLALAKDQKQALPHVKLPGLNEVGAEKNDALVNSVTSGNAASNSVLNPSLVGGNSPTQTTQAVQPAHTVALPHVVNHAPVTDQVHVAIKRAAQDGLQQITIQLDPVDLGRVEVKMQMGVDGQTQISFIADKASTFDSLSRDARMLEQSLHEAGIKADTGSMQFNLRQQPQPQLQSDLGQGQGQKDQQSSNDASEADGNAVGGVGSLAAAASRYYNVNIHDGVDIRA